MSSGYCRWDTLQELEKVLTQLHAGGLLEEKTAQESATYLTRKELKCRNWFSIYFEEYIRNWKLLSTQQFEC